MSSLVVVEDEEDRSKSGSKSGSKSKEGSIFFQKKRSTSDLQETIVALNNDNKRGQDSIRRLNLINDFLERKKGGDCVISESELQCLSRVSNTKNPILSNDIAFIQCSEQDMFSKQFQQVSLHDLSLLDYAEQLKQPTEKKSVSGESGVNFVSEIIATKTKTCLLCDTPNDPVATACIACTLIF